MEIAEWERRSLREVTSILRDVLATLFRAASDLAFPPSCGFCGEPLQEPDRFICPHCISSVRRIEPPFCDRCGRQFGGIQANEQAICGSCLAKNPPYGKARYAVRYEGDFRNALIAFKYNGVLHLGNALGRFLIEAFQLHYADTAYDDIVPIPLHPKRLCSRGHNQVVILGEKLSRATGIHLARTVLEKKVNRPPQVGLTRNERVVNVRGSFKVARPDTFKGRKLLLVDDVATTGATVTEAAKTLMRSGASHVDALVLAFRPPYSDRPDGSENDAPVK